MADTTQMRPTKVSPTQLAGTQLAGTQVAGTQLAGTQVAGTQVAGTQLAPTELPIPAPPPPPSIPVAPTSKAQQTLEQFNQDAAQGKRGKRQKAEPTQVNYTTRDVVEIDDNKIQSMFSEIQIGAGLAVAFFVLIGLIWLLVPTASGYTRGQLLWFTMFGQTKLTTDHTFQSVPESPSAQNNTSEGPSQEQLSQPMSQASNQNAMSTIDFSNLDMYNGL